MKTQKHINKNNKKKGLAMKRKIALVLIAAAAFVFLNTQSAFATGTPAGTVITNTAKMVWKDISGNLLDSTTATATTTVEKLAGLSLNPTGTFQYASDSMYVYLPMTVHNTGNASDSLTFTSTDDKSFTPTVYLDADGDGVLDPGETTVLSTHKVVGMDDSLKFIVRLYVPPGTASNTLDTIRTVVTSEYDNGTDPIVSVHSRDSVKIKALDIDLTKSDGGASPEPGDTITYTVSFTNNGTGTGTNPSLYDTLSNHVTYLAGSAAINSGGGSITYNSGSKAIEWTSINKISAGGTGSITFKVTVNSGVPAGTTISNTAYLNVTDSIRGTPDGPIPGGPEETVVSEQGNWELKVEVAGGSAFTTNNKLDSVNVSEPIHYRLKLTNTGNRTDTASFDRTSTRSLSWVLFVDFNGNGSIDGSDSTVNLSYYTTGGIAQNASMYFIAYDTIPQSKADRGLDTAKYTVASITLSAEDSGFTYTRIKAPVMNLSKSVSSTNNRTRPGDTLTYVISYTNNGSGQANQIVITDVSPSNTSYVPNSVSMSTDNVTYTAKTDASDADAVTVSSGTVTVSVGNVGPGYLGDSTYRGYIKFKVVID